MGMSGWSVVVGPLFSFLIGGLLGKELYRYLDKPKVTIRVRRPVLFAQEDGYFISIKIANAGRTAAESCIGTMTLFDIANEQIINAEESAINENLHEYREENYQFTNPRPQFVTRDSMYQLSNEPLCWADLGNPPSISINPGTTHRLDLCKFFCTQNESYFIFPSDRGWRRVRTRLKAEAIRGRVLICPANDFPTPAYFTINIDNKGIPQITMNEPTFWQKLKTRFNRSEAFLD